MVDVFFSTFWISVLIFGMVLYWLIFFFIRKIIRNKSPTIYPVVLLLMAVYFAFSIFSYFDVRQEFDATKEDVILKVTSSTGFGLESSDGERYVPKRGSIGTKIVYLFNANDRPEIGSCIRIELNYYNEMKSYTYINFGKVYQADCENLMHSREVANVVGEAMKNRWDYRKAKNQ